MTANDSITGRDLLSLSLVSEGCWEIAKQYINARCAFRYHILFFSFPFFWLKCVCSVPISFATEKYQPQKIVNVKSAVGVPSSVREISFYNLFDNPVDNLPSTITHLKFGNSFDRPVNYLPSSITHLKFGNEFNCPVNNLPKSLIHLSFGNKFDQPVDHLPRSLSFLHLGSNFNQPVNSLPSTVINLILGSMFHQPLNSLPPRLTHLIFMFTSCGQFGNMTLTNFQTP